MKRKKIIKYIVLPLLVILAITAAYIYKEYNRAHKDTAKLKPDYSVTATNLLNEFSANEQSSNKKYWDKVLRVEGLVKDVVKDDRGFYSIILGDSASASSVRCSVDSVHSGEAAAVYKGGFIAVKGICSGYNADELLGSDVILVRSVVDFKK
jgi:tRNA_anti-like